LNRCPITYEPCGENLYSLKGLHSLSNKLNRLELFPFTAEAQREEAIIRSAKMSIGGVQPKLSVRLNVREAVFEIVDRKGKYILKPQNLLYPELPQNEDLTMRLARLSGIEVPLHGMIYSHDMSLTYFIKRFDRGPGSIKIPVEDFAQLAGESRDTKYDYSMEKLIRIIEEFCTFPAIEKIKLFRVVLFNYITGNEDMHLKNFSIVTLNDKMELSPFYDLINTTISIRNAAEEIALPLNGKKKNLTRNDLIKYYAAERLGLNNKIIEEELNNLNESISKWEKIIDYSFLSGIMKQKYLSLVNDRKRNLGF
jgi:serine/threonine-protein kinase HipA